MVLYTGHDYESFRRRVSLLESSLESREIGDVKYGFQTNDHRGWVLLDGRDVSLLPVIQQANASSLGFIANIPDSFDAYFGSVGGVGLGSTVGSNSVVINRSNLPDFTLSGTTSTDGNHSHQVRYSHQASGGGNGRVGAGSNHNSQIPTLNGGNHSHSITTESLNGGVTQQLLDVKPLTINVNVFIFLGGA